MSKRLVFILTVVLILCFSTHSKANIEDDIGSITVTVTIKDNGDADIREDWSVYNISGTEWYKPIYNLNHMTLENFSVNKDSDFEYVENWKKLKSFGDKANKYGIVKMQDGIELCWGKTIKGNYSYKINYTYKNFVTSFKDNKNGFIVKLVNDNMKPAPRRVIIKIKTEDGKAITKENSKVWMFGNDGDINYNTNGTITGRNNNFKPEYSAIVMMELDNDVVHPEVVLNKSFEDVKNKALNNSSYMLEDNSFWGRLNKSGRRVLKFMYDFLFGWIAIFAVIFSSKDKMFKKPKNIKEIDFESKPYNRDSILNNYGLYNIAALGRFIIPSIENDTIISAQLLQWINDDKLRIVGGKNSKDILFRIKDTTDDELLKLVDNYVHKELTGSITVSALGESLSRDINKVDSLIEKDPVDTGYVYRKGFRSYLTDEGKELMRDINGSYNFLRDFTLIEEKEIDDIYLWEEYLILATLFNMPKSVTRALADACPDINRYKDIIGNVNASDVMKTVRYASYSYKSEVYRGSTMGDSSGGRASIGGGSGFSGGGSGGGSR